MKITVEVTSKGQARLIEEMAERLRRKAPDKPRKWGKMGLRELGERLIEQASKLAKAEGRDAWKKAADVANFAAMVADRRASDSWLNPAQPPR